MDLSQPADDFNSICNTSYMSTGISFHLTSYGNFVSNLSLTFYLTDLEIDNAVH